MAKEGKLSRAALEKLSAKKRMDALLDSDDARKLVRGLPIQLLYRTIAEVGLADATGLVQLASPDQYRTLVDLAAWEGDRLDVHEVLTWLRAARGDEPEEFSLKLANLDLEILELLLRELTQIYDRDEDPDADPQGVTIETPDNKYLIELKVEGVQMAALRTLVNDIIAQDPFQSSRLFEAIRWELPSEMEEIAYRFRSARLQDLGFPLPEEAAGIYAWVDPEPLRPPQKEGLARSPASNDEYLSACLNALTPHEAALVEEELRLLVNSALVAEAADPGDLEDVRRIAEQTRDYLALGFEHLTGQDPSRSADLVQQHTLKKIFQVGFSLTLDLKRRADRLAKTIFSIDGQPVLLSFERVSFAALRRKRPLRAVRVEGADPVSFRSRAELAAAIALLGRIERQAEVFKALLKEGPDAVARFATPFFGLGADRLFASILAHTILDGRVWVGPLSPSRASELYGRLFEGDAAAPSLRKAARDKAVATLEPEVPAPLKDELAAMVDSGLARLLQEISTPFLRDGRVADSAAATVFGLQHS